LDAGPNIGLKRGGAEPVGELRKGIVAGFERARKSFYAHMLRDQASTARLVREVADGLRRAREHDDFDVLEESVC
jgi:hypothetical protein